MASIFGWYNLVTLSDTEIVATDGGTAIASLQNINYPLSNIRINKTVKEFRTNTGTLSATFVIDCQAPMSADSVFLIGNSVTGILSVDSLTIKGSANNSAANWAAATAYTFSGSSFVDENEFFAYGSIGTTLTYRYFQITVTNPSTYVGFSNIFIGQTSQLSVGTGWSMQRIDRTLVQEGRYGQKEFDRIADQKVFDFSMDYINATERRNLDGLTVGGFPGMFDYCGVHKPVWFILDTAETILTNKDIAAGYCYFDSRPGIVSPHTGLYSTAFKLVQVM